MTTRQSRRATALRGFWADGVPRSWSYCSRLTGLASERGGVKRPHGRIVLRREGEVHVLGDRSLVVDQREAEVLADHLDVVWLVQADPQPGVRGDRHVEALGRGEVADADPQVVDAADG